MKLKFKNFIFIKKRYLVLFFLSFLSVFLSITMDYTIRGYDNLDYFLFLTHWTNIGILIYSLICIFYKENVTSLVFYPSIIIVGILYMTFAFFPYFFSLFKIAINNGGDNYSYDMNPVAYFFSSIFSTLLLHFFVPFFSYKLIKKDYEKFSLGYKKNFLIGAAFLFFYFIVVEVYLIINGPNDLIGKTDSPAPYFFMDFFKKPFFIWILNFSILFFTLFVLYLVTRFLK